MMHPDDITDLSAAALRVEAVDIYCGDRYPISPDWFSMEREALIETLRGHCGDDFKIDPEADDDEIAELCAEHIDEDSFAPMMEYAWPLPGERRDPSELAALIIDCGAVCIVALGENQDDPDDVAIGFSGGGMDLSWDLARAYIALGYLPPLDVDPPGFEVADGPQILSAMRESRRVEIARCQSFLDRHQEA